MKKYNEQFTADCPKCGLTFTGNSKYFRFDIKEKCFDGITTLVNYRIAGTKFDAVADKVASEMIANASKWHSDLVSGKIPLD